MWPARTRSTLVAIPHRDGGLERGRRIDTHREALVCGELLILLENQQFATDT